VFFWIVFGALVVLGTSTRRPLSELATRLVAGLSMAVTLAAVGWLFGLSDFFASRDGAVILVTLFLAVLPMGFLLAGSRTHHAKLTCAGLVCIGCFQTAERAMAHLAHGRWSDASAMLVVSATAPSGFAGYTCETGRWRSTRSGLAILETRDVCWETPLPSTRYFNPCLSLREVGNLAGGFVSRAAPDMARYGYLSHIEFVGGKDLDVVTPDSVCRDQK